MEKFGDRFLRDLATLTVLQHACIVFKDDTSRENRDYVQQVVLHQTERITRTMRRIACDNHTSPIANAIVSQLSNHTAIALQHLHNETQRSTEDIRELLPSLGTLALELSHCQHANASRSLADALALFNDNESDYHQMRRYYSQQYNEVAHVLNAYIEQLNEGGSSLPTTISSLSFFPNCYSQHRIQ